MNRSKIFIAVALAALSSMIATPAFAEGSLFGGARLTYVSSESDSNVLTIEGNGDTAEMLLVKEKGEDSKKVSLSTDNVLSIEEDDDVTVQEDRDFTKAMISRDGNPDHAIRVPITQNGEINLDQFGQGIYSLFVVVDDDRAYEAIIVIGEEDNNTVDRTINRFNTFITIITEIIFEIPETPTPEEPTPPITITPPVCRETEVLYGGECLIDDYDCEDERDFLDPRCEGREPPTPAPTLTPEPEPITPLLTPEPDPNEFVMDTPVLTPTPEPSTPPVDDEQVEDLPDEEVEKDIEETEEPSEEITEEEPETEENNTEETIE